MKNFYLGTGIAAAIAVTIFILEGHSHGLIGLSCTSTSLQPWQDWKTTTLEGLFQDVPTAKYS